MEHHPVWVRCRPRYVVAHCRPRYVVACYIGPGMHRPRYVVVGPGMWLRTVDELAIGYIYT